MRLAAAGAGALLLSCFPSHVAPDATVPQPYAQRARPVIDRQAREVEQIHREIAPRLAKLEPDETARVAAAIVEECARASLDPLFVLAVIEAESRFDVEAQSPTGCRGLMQLAPKTFRKFSQAKRFLDPVANVRAGIRYLRYLIGRGFRHPESVLAAYNQGEGAAADVFVRGEEMPEEAALFVPRVMGGYERLLKKHGKRPQDARRLWMARAPAAVVE